VDSTTDSTDADIDADVADASPPSTGGVSRGYRKGAETRERLISSAQDTIHELGFNRASSREIARRSGVTYGVIQHHFGTYEAVLLAAVQREGARLRELLTNAEISGTTTEEKLASVVELVWSFVSRPENLVYMEIHTNLMRDPSTSEDAIRLLHEGTSDIEELWLEVMRKAFDQQEQDPRLRRLLFGTMRGLAISAWMNQGALDFTTEREIFVEAMAPYFERSAKGLGATTRPTV
jgi:AcrR family transcriptional regulator